MDHIDDMEQLRQGVGLQAYGQRDPLVEYKMSGYEIDVYKRQGYRRWFSPAAGGVCKVTAVERWQAEGSESRPGKA